MEAAARTSSQSTSSDLYAEWAGHLELWRNASNAVDSISRRANTTHTSIHIHTSEQDCCGVEDESDVRRLVGGGRPSPVQPLSVPT